MTDDSGAAPRRPTVCVVGSLNADLVLQAPNLPAEGETVIGTGSSRLNGGKGANQAVAAARLGATTHMVGRIGRDADGDRLFGALGAEGMGVAALGRVDGQPTGLAVITVDPDGRNSICVIQGANAELSPDAVAEAVDAARPDVVITQLEIRPESAGAAMAAARRAGAIAVLNAAPAPTSPLPFLADVDVLVVNEIEAAAMAGFPAAGTAEVPSPEPVELADRLLAAGPGLVAITLGAAGCLVADADGAWRVAGIAVDVADTTGAGDCFVAAFAVGLGRGASPTDAARLATAASAMAVQRAGAQEAMPRWQDVIDFLPGVAGAVAAR